MIEKKDRLTREDVADMQLDSVSPAGGRGRAGVSSGCSSLPAATE